MTDNGRESRRKAAANAIAITEMEGGSPSPRVRELLQAWIDGHISSQGMREAMLEHVKLPTATQD
ncbi:antitoxin VbhA family protein [Bradyrhizobium diazoefficiens]